MPSPWGILRCPNWETNSNQLDIEIDRDRNVIITPAVKVKLKARFKGLKHMRCRDLFLDARLMINTPDMGASWVIELNSAVRSVAPLDQDGTPNNPDPSDLIEVDVGYRPTLKGKLAKHPRYLMYYLDDPVSGQTYLVSSSNNGDGATFSAINPDLARAANEGVDVTLYGTFFEADPHNSLRFHVDKVVF